MSIPGGVCRHRWSAWSFMVCRRPIFANRNTTAGGLFAVSDRAAGLALLNEKMVCIRRVIIEPRYRGLGLATRLVTETLPQTGAAMVEAVSAMGRVHPFLERAGMRAFEPVPEARTERMAAALSAVGIEQTLWHNSADVDQKIQRLTPPIRTFIEHEIQQFFRKFTNRRKLSHSHKQIDFVLSKLASQRVYYLCRRDER